MVVERHKRLWSAFRDKTSTGMKEIICNYLLQDFPIFVSLLFLFVIGEMPTPLTAA